MLSDEPDRPPPADSASGTDPHEAPEAPTETVGESPEPHLQARERWLSAVAYLGPGFLIPMFSARPRGDFVRWHTQQGFVLFFLEAVLLALVVIFDQTLGRIPILGFLVMIVVELLAFVAVLLASIVGFVKALAGEWFRFPVLEEYAERIPIED